MNKLSYRARFQRLPYPSAQVVTYIVFLKLNVRFIENRFEPIAIGECCNSKRVSDMDQRLFEMTLQQCECNLGPPTTLLAMASNFEVHGTASVSSFVNERPSRLQSRPCHIVYIFICPQRHLRHRVMDFSRRNGATN
jgi:hypothetical protein